MAAPLLHLVSNVQLQAHTINTCPIQQHVATPTSPRILTMVDEGRDPNSTIVDIATTTMLNLDNMT